jgi:hypothetical protein
MVGVINVIKGKMFEHLVAIHENTDGDEWKARLHEDESYPGSDIIFTNVETGDEIEVSLKAVEGAPIIEAALLKYPDIPIITTSEVGNMYSDDPRISAFDMNHSELHQNTEEFLASLTAASDRSQAMLGVAAGTAAASIIQLWPLIIARLRDRITQDQLEEAFVELLGEQGKKLAVRVALAGILGPIYAWYLLAKGVMNLTPEVDEEAVGTDVIIKSSRLLEYKSPVAFTL